MDSYALRFKKKMRHELQMLQWPELLIYQGLQV